MSEEKKTKTTFATGLKQEFRKIIWPNKNSLVRQTIAVVVVTVVLGLIIAAVDYAAQLGIDVLMSF
ncbi:MAG: preprotein translocase subunit SecE [Lachnospiraceae bacterium]|jgi:preprotein translocase subunit SecE|nr:preprotein translocase subunit SecE [Lachnospiraceae bacterium]